MAGLGADIRAENLDEFILERLNMLDDAGRANLPDYLVRKLWKHKKWMLPEGLSNLDVAELLHHLKYNIIILIEDEETGLDAQSFLVAKKALKGKLSMSDSTLDMRAKNAFLLSSKDLANSLAYMRLSGVGKVYKLVRKLGDNPEGARRKKYGEWIAAMRWLITALIRYEGSRKSFYSRYTLEQAEWYCLLFYYFREGPANDFFKGPFVGANASSEINMKKALYNLTSRKLITRQGPKRSYKYSISPSGQEIVDKVLSEYMLVGI